MTPRRKGRDATPAGYGFLTFCLSSRSPLSSSFAATVESLGDATIDHDVRSGSWTIAAGGASMSDRVHPIAGLRGHLDRESRRARTGSASPVRTRSSPPTACRTPSAAARTDSATRPCRPATTDGTSSWTSPSRCSRRTCSSPGTSRSCRGRRPSRCGPAFRRWAIRCRCPTSTRFSPCVSPGRDPLADRSPARSGRHHAGHGVRATSSRRWMSARR